MFQADFSLEVGILIRGASHLCINSFHAHIDEKASFGIFNSVTREKACVITVFCSLVFDHRAKVGRRVKNGKDRGEGGRDSVIKKRKKQKTLRTTACQDKSTELAI